MTSLHFNGLYKLGIDAPYDFNKEDSVWIGFYSLYKTLTEYKNDVNISNIKDSLKEWIKDYLFISKKENFSQKLTPYLHSLVFHYIEMLALHGNIHKFSTQPNEKLNDFFTQYYHKSTNKHFLNNNFISQIMKKRNRIEFYNLKGDVGEFFDFNNESDYESDLDDE